MGRVMLCHASHAGGVEAGQALGRAVGVRLFSAPQEHTHFQSPGQVHHMRDGDGL